MPTLHEPVLLEEVLDILEPQPGQNFIDCTFGGGGHSLAILKKIEPDGKVLGIDWDCRALSDSHNKNLILIKDNYCNLKKIYNQVSVKHDFEKVSGILLDLGLSSDQLEDLDRGFSFFTSGKLDMRFDKDSERITAGEILLTYSQKELENIFRNFGEEPLAVLIARKIVIAREAGEDLQSADMLVRLIEEIYRKKFKSKSRKHPATRVFQALRIAVNNEFENIEKTLPQAIDLLAKGGKLVVISFHSGEDRIVKNFFRKMSKVDDSKIKIINKKPIIAKDKEIKNNLRSRSAKLRAIEKINN
jgi:16S rRNA (cytosine1402-N4)-methyltransferase